MKKVRRYLEFIFGVFCIAFSFNVLLLPNDIVFGGVSGVSIITKNLFNLEPASFILITSIILLLVSFIFLGKKQTIASIFGSLLFPIFIKVTVNFESYLHLGQLDLLLAAVFGGLINGLGAGLIFRAGFTTGGTDILNQIVSKYFKVSIGNAMIFVDGLIVISGVFVFGINKLLYALITLYVISSITDKVLLGISSSKAFYIVTSCEKEVKDYILNNLGHGITIFNAIGGYSKANQKVLMCVIPTREYFKLKEGIHEIDQDAFFVVTDSYQVYGGE